MFQEFIESQIVYHYGDFCPMRMESYFKPIDRHIPLPPHFRDMSILQNFSWESMMDVWSLGADEYEERKNSSLNWAKRYPIDSVYDGSVFMERQPVWVGTLK